MPIFEYVCGKCTHSFETLVQGSKVPACPSCGSRELEKQFSAFAVAGQSQRLAAREPVGACSTCGDPRGAGACSMG